MVTLWRTKVKRRGNHTILLKNIWANCKSFDEKLNERNVFKGHEARHEKQLQKVSSSNQMGATLAKRIKVHKSSQKLIIKQNSLFHNILLLNFQDCRTEKSISESHVQKETFKSRDLLTKVNAKQKKIGQISKPI